MTCKCFDCGRIFDNDEARIVHYIGGETERYCPSCDSDNWDEVEKCDDCGEYFKPEELRGAKGDCRCVECLKKRATVEMALAAGKESPIKINGFFEQFFYEELIVEWVESFLWEKVRQAHTEESIKGEAVAYLCEDIDWFADFVMSQEAEHEAENAAY